MDLESIIYKDPTIVNPQKGDLLIAEPLLDEPYFKRSVILLLDEDNNQGHIGLALNKITPVSLQDLFPDWKAGAEVPVYSGGPVEADRLFMLHTMGDRFEGSMEVSPGLYVGAKLDDIIDYINNNRYADGNIRFFLGYSGWSKGQLTSEILTNTWALNPNPGHTDVLTGAEDLYWRREVRRLGEKYRSWLLVPSNPAFN
ncbi:YqgE/AlgH family protein [Muribaculaceae bacterium Isolate-113 (HZI)]|nr:YqgE/AlgH family protein [Muribaculaceae bacterium Isolate-113 (HZI)]ROT24167.1 YqgE/AlgH family protein [Muribaculaceae bacterium Isolate-114 (HZI)]